MSLALLTSDNLQKKLAYASIITLVLLLAIVGYSGHYFMMNAKQAQLMGLSLFLISWLMMTMAMMLPTMIPLLLMFYRITVDKPLQTLLMVSVTGGYLSVWCLFGVIIFYGSLVIKYIFSNIFHGQQAWLLSASLLFIAGIFQFSSLKYQCLRKCRSTYGFIVTHWRGGNTLWQSFRLGTAHGLFCIGCCWALMLLMFIVSAYHLVWMLALALVMAIEKNVSWGSKITKPLGILLVFVAMIVTINQ